MGMGLSSVLMETPPIALLFHGLPWRTRQRWAPVYDCRPRTAPSRACAHPWSLAEAPADLPCAVWYETDSMPQSRGESEERRWRKAGTEDARRFASVPGPVPARMTRDPLRHMARTPCVPGSLCHSARKGDKTAVSRCPQLRRGDRGLAIRDGQAPCATVKLTGTQGNHIIHLGPGAEPKR